MKITLQTLKSVKYEIEVKDTDTVAEIKQRAEKEHDIGEAASMKLIHQGKILKDTQTIADAKIKAGDFLVVMVSAKRTATTATPPAAAAQPAPAKVAAAPVPTPAPAPAPVEVKATPTPAPVPVTAPTPVATTPTTAATTATATGAAPTTGAYQNAASTLVMGTAYEDSIASLMGLGFSHSMVVAALKASYNTPDRAADYLFSGKTEAELQAMAAAATGAPGAAGGAGRGAPPPSATPGGNVGATPTSPTPVTPPAGVLPTGGATAGATGGAPGNPMAALAGPEFAALRGMIQENPQIVPYLLQQLAQTNPGLMQAMGQNPQAVMNMFGQAMGLPGATPSAGRGVTTPTGAAVGRGTPAGRGALPPGMVAGPGGTIGVTITPEEKAILDRLEALGYSRQKVLEAFLLCDRSEEAAANYLMDHGMDQMDEFQD